MCEIFNNEIFTNGLCCDDFIKDSYNFTFWRII